MTISSRLYLAFTLFALALCASGIAAIALLSHSQSRFEYIHENTLPSVRDLDKSIAAATAVRRALYQLVLSSNSSRSAEAGPDLPTLIERVRKSIDYYEAHDISDDADRRMTELSRTDLAAFQTQLPILLTASGQHDIAHAIAILADETAGPSAALSKLIDDLTIQIDYNVKLGENLRIENHRAFTLATWSMSIGVLGVLIVVGGSVGQVVHGIGRSLASLQDTMKRMRGTLDLTYVARIERMDEIGHITTEFNTLIERVRHAMCAVADAADHVRATAREISNASAYLSTRTEQQAASLEETASSMGELTARVRQNADSARQASGLATRAARTAGSGNDAVCAMVETMKRINEGSARIVKITSVIEHIAFQTNLLALNAAVEAARAGKHGLGFAVVTSEVRGLAKSTSLAAREIKTLIDSSVRMAQDGLRQATDAGLTINEVKASIGRVSDFIGEITAASDEQSRGIEQIGQAVNQMDATTQQNAALVEEAAAAAQSLYHHARLLEDAISAFRIDTAVVGKARGGPHAAHRLAALASTAS